MIDPCFPSVSEAQLHLNFDVSEFDLTANAIDGPSISSQLCSQVASVCPRPGQYSADSASSQEDADTSLPNDWGLRILSLLSKDRTQAATADCNTSPSESINGDCQQQASEQAATEPRDQPVEDRDTRQREKNKRAQKRHRDRLKAKEEATAATIESLAAQLRTARWEKAIAEQRADTLSQALNAKDPCCSSEQAQGHARVHEYWPTSGWIPQAVMRISVHSGPSQLVTAEQVKTMSVGDHQQLWKVLIFKLAHLLPATQGRMDTEAGARMQELMAEHGMRAACLAAFNFETSHALFNSNIETGEAASLARVPAEKWRSVLAAAELTSFQKEQILRLRQHYYQQAGHIAARRQRMMPWFQEALNGSCKSIAGLSSQFVSSQAAMLEMQETLLLEQNLYVSLLGSIWRRTTTAMQGAIMMVQSYPHTVDLIAVMNCLAEDYREPSIEDLMQSHVNCAVTLDSSALKVPSPDLLLELLSWTQGSQMSQASFRPLLTA